jgi:stress response protein SCP2
VNAIDTVLLRRNALVFIAPDAVSSGSPEPRDFSSTVRTPNLVAALEVELLALGFVLSPALRDALMTCDLEQLRALHAWLLPSLAAGSGAHRGHVPMFRTFPNSVPADTWRLYLDRVLTYLLQEPDQPCVQCGRVGTVHALDPCGHLVCTSCWDGANYSGCPICHRHINPDQPFVKPAPPRAPLQDSGVRLSRLDLGEDRVSSATQAMQGLLTRVTPLSVQDRADLLTLLGGFGVAALRALPERIPIKETMALTLGTLIRQPSAFADHAHVFAQHLRTSTDALRVIAVWMGMDPSLARVSSQTRKWLTGLLNLPKSQWDNPQFKYQYFPRVRSMPRGARKGLLASLETLEVHSLTEDLRRHSVLWKRVAQVLHPFEFHRRFPKTALAFAVLRSTDVSTVSAELRESLARAATPRTPLEDGRYQFRSWASSLEQALREHDLGTVARLLAQRPGELGRRLDHALREINAHQPEVQDALLESLGQHATRMGVPMLLTLLAHMGTRLNKLPKRVFFPKGEVLYGYATPDARSTLPPVQVERITDTLEQELLGRAGAQTSLSSAVLDEGLRDLFVPFAERSASPSRIVVPRGSLLPIPNDTKLRLFMHWMEARNQRVDLDLSVSFFDARWRFQDKCDFTNLSDANGAFVHSGDYTDAPEPLGASEFVDLDLPKLRARGIRYAMMIVFSYNSVPFDRMPFAFAGVMHRRDNSGEVFEPRTVEHRFDLQGNAQIAIPMFVDLERARMRWLDVKLTQDGMNHQVGGYYRRLAGLGADMDAYFSSGARATLWPLACLHAAARTKRVLVRQSDQSILEFNRRDRETPLEFYRRAVHLEHPDARLERIPEMIEPTFAALMRHDLELPDGSRAYALDWANQSASRVKRLTAGDLLKF